MTITFDKTAYVNLLADFVPQVINSEAEYDRALAIAEPLVANRNLSNEESKFLSLIVTLIEDYEGKHYPMGDVSREHPTFLNGSKVLAVNPYIL